MTWQAGGSSGLRFQMLRSIFKVAYHIIVHFRKQSNRHIRANLFSLRRHPLNPGFAIHSPFIPTDLYPIGLGGVKHYERSASLWESAP